MLTIKNLTVYMNNRELLSDINLEIKTGERHLLCGHNGSGKSTLAQTIVGIPEYEIKSGQIIFDQRDITNENITTRALMGIFLGAQHVPEIPGLTLISFLKHSCAAHTHFNTGHDLSMAEFLENMETTRTKLGIPREWLNRSINVGFSGGERKRIMLLHLMLTNPKFAILDEPDSGADAETKKLIADTIHNMPDTTFLIISHQTDFTKQINITNTTTLSDGKIMIK
ncbi:MAG: ATP-binding cassette domain-containing protein [Alphaproteobacteria bacterium]|nr:ATP-binding cassette domain-containing protein [Alphaproteobacteria bacterium]